MQNRLVFLLIIIISLSHTPYEIYAQQNGKVTVRAAKHPSYLRVVFTGSEDIIKNSSVILQNNNTIKVNLKVLSEIEVQPYGTLKNNTTIEILKGLKISNKDNFFFLIYEGIEDIEVSKLTSPHRLVVDI
ncbi:MAG: hypothetical protein SNJ53_02265, partial [Thermodesulfovibrionales bacterium]